MAIGSSGVSLFTGTRGLVNVFDNLYVRVYWQQEYTPGAAKSTLRITKITAQSEKYSYGGTFFLNGILTINGETVSEKAMGADDKCTISKDYETTLPFGEITREISQPGGAAATISIGFDKRPNTSYTKFVFWNNTYNDYTCYLQQTNQITFSTIPQAHTLSISQGAGSWASVTRGGAALSSGATIYDGEVLAISGGANTGYNFSGLSVNGSGFSSGGTLTVSGNVSVATSASLKSYTLSISPGNSSWITVTRGGTALSNGAIIYHFDTLVISAGANTGYNFGVLNVNGSSFSSGGSISVSGGVSVSAFASLKSYTLAISQGAGSWISVTRGGQALYNGSTIYHFDTLVISGGANNGYNFGGLKVDGAASTSGESTTVSGNVSVSATASVKTFSLSLQPGTGTTLSCYRTASPKGGASSVWLNSGATLYYGDTITITGSANDGYNFGGVTVNGNAYQNGAPMEVTGAVTVKSSATVQQFRLSISAGKGLSLTVSRLSSPKAGAATGTLSGGSAIFHGDTLQITATTESGYALNTLTVNGNAINSGAVITVTGNVAVAATAKDQGLAYIGNEKYMAYIGTNGVYQQYQPYIGAADGSKWELQS